MTHIPADIAQQIQADIKAIAQRDRIARAEHQTHLTTAARQAGTEWAHTKGRIPGATTAAAHIAAAVHRAARRPNGTPAQPDEPSA